jgi:serine/threonine protein kinase
MKIQKRSNITEAKMQKRLILEYENLANLSVEQADCICRLACSFQTSESFYIVMEFQPGGDLFSLYRANMKRETGKGSRVQQRRCQYR